MPKKLKYQTPIENPPIPGGEIRRMIDKCSDKSKFELDILINVLKESVDHNFGEDSALQLLGRLVQLGLIGPLEIDQDWLKRIRSQ
jgi:hypothetical protein